MRNLVSLADDSNKRLSISVVLIGVCTNKSPYRNKNDRLGNKQLTGNEQVEIVPYPIMLRDF